jgi:hypothetical protein
MIIIIGDSWGVGEWAKSGELSGPGVGQLLMLTGEVANLSVGAASNTLCLSRITRFLNQFNPSSDDQFYWVVTCPSRCVIPDYYAESNNTLIETHLNLLDLSLARANNIARQHNITINLIGGLCDLDTVPVTSYKNLTVRVASWGKLLTPEYNSYPGMPTSIFWEELGIRVKQNNLEKLQQWIDLSTAFEKKANSWKLMRQTYFSTDGVHPDRRGHRILRDYLYPEFAYKG